MVDQNVLRLDVTMDKVCWVQVVQGFQLIVEDNFDVVFLGLAIKQLLQVKLTYFHHHTDEVHMI